MRRIGPRMQQAVYYVKHHPGCAILPVAKHVAPHGTGIAFGYRTVHRAIKAGLITAVRKASRYELTAVRS